MFNIGSAGRQEFHQRECVAVPVELGKAGKEFVAVMTQHTRSTTDS
jgi:hypothetical protein